MDPQKMEQETAEAVEVPSGLALRLVLDYLPAEDIVSCGQVCRCWRFIAKGQDVWMTPRLRIIDPDIYLCHGRESAACGTLMRIIQFAPSGVQLETFPRFHFKPTPDQLVKVLIASQIQVKSLDITPLKFTSSADYYCLLEKSAPQLESLRLTQEIRSSLLAIEGKALRLRSLTLKSPFFKNYESEFAPLPESLEELQIDDTTEEFLEAALALPLLRSLYVHVRTKLESCVKPSSNVAGLRRLVIGMRWPDTLTLTHILQTHSATLEYLKVFCASQSMTAQTLYFVPSIHEILKQCRFAKLKEILLVRNCSWCTASHGQETCKLQVGLIKSVLQKSLETGKQAEVRCGYRGCNGEDSSSDDQDDYFDEELCYADCSTSDDDFYYLYSDDGGDNCHYQ